MENKTAIEMLIDIIKEKRKESDISNTLLRFCQVEAEKLLPKEREQIESAYANGAIDFQLKRIEFTNGDDIEYYNETFKK